MAKKTAKATGVRIAFEVDWREDDGGYVSGYIGVGFSVSADGLDEPLKSQVLALAQKAAEHIEELDE